MRSWKILILLCVSVLLVSPALAAETGTYRPGQAYQSVSVANPNVCASHCRGDRHCKGWNFIRVRPNNPDGVCELNARRVAPVPSAISISGDAVNAKPSTQLVSSGMRTVRVGALPTAPQNQTVRVGQVPEAPAAPAKPRRVVNHQPVPQRQQVTPAMHRKPVARSAPQPQMPATQAPRPAPIPAQPAPTPRFQHNLDSAPPVAKSAARSTPPTPRSFQAQKLRALIEAQNAQSAPAAPQANSGSALPPRAPQGPIAANLPTERAQQSLFGSLYDDVKAPKVLGPEDIPADKDAPIATVNSVPTQKVTSENMMAGPPAPN